MNSFFRALIFGEDNVYTCAVKEGRGSIKCSLSSLCARGSKEDQTGGSAGIELGNGAKGSFT